jgi:hypothetical protein
MLAKAIMKIQILTGFIPKTLGKGHAAQLLHDALSKLTIKKSMLQHNSKPEFDSMLFFDRTIDLLTPLRTQLTYEGLIDEIFGIECSNY